MTRCLPVSLLATITFVFPAVAVDGVREINQACASGIGCFPGDAPDFPVEISEEGSYRLTGNLFNFNPALPGVAAVRILTSNVTLDLNGFTISGDVQCGAGAAGCSGGGLSGAGIHAAGRNVQIHNGFVTGRNVGLQVGDESHLHHLKVSGNLGSGIVGGGNVAIHNVIVELNQLNGISLGRSANLRDVVASRNGVAGIHLRDGSVEGIVASENNGFGINAERATRIARSVTRGNFGPGVRCGQEEIGGCAIAGVTAESNLGDGIKLEGVASARDCVVSRNLNGLVVGSGQIHGVTADNNLLTGIKAAHTTSISDSSSRKSGLHGIECGAADAGGCSLSNVTARDSSANGIVLGPNSSLAGCSADGNGNHGIHLHPGATVSGCSASGNAVNGILALGAAVIRNNVTKNNAFGIAVNGDAFIVGNTSTDNTNTGIVTSLAIPSSYKDNWARANGVSNVAAGLINLGGNVCLPAPCP